MKKSISPPFSSQSGASFLEIMTGITIVGMLVAITVVGIYTFRASHKIDLSLEAIYQLKEAVKRHNKNAGSYNKSASVPVLWSANMIPDQFDKDEKNRIIYTAMGHPVTITARGQHFSIEVYALGQSECPEIMAKLLEPQYFPLGDISDDLDLIKLGNTVYDDKTLPTQRSIDSACRSGISVDLILAFR